ncbi:hypothetical protein [Brachybacterium fresconis]|uniref:SAM-dependent methyltransferase n=1 Tax=Brachybacterium fresconis TaxID=173363 RepID=A0ABS4YFB1_9MICO|nr:hypothetical protein [Brachybacterium fresconis]MBP2407419.1 SAM-dependent methyltransferase [Brachybacterium fresconis]
MVDEQDLSARRAAPAERPTVRDVSALTGYREQEPPWSWRTLVENLAPMSDRVLDLGAGGGETLPADAFDLVLSRHEAYDASDVARVLAPGGTFLTQQVGGDDLQEIRDAVGLEAPFSEVTLENFVHELHRCGLTVQRSDAFHGAYEFDDVAALLAYLCRSPWDAPADLDVDRHRPQLEALEEERAGGPLTATVSRFLILARAPGHPDAGRTDFAAIARERPEVPRV